jgi:hypothetical protein
MINLRFFSTDRYGLPILSENDLDNIGELLVRDFAPEALKVPQEIDIEAFSELYMGLRQDFQYLTHRGIYLGMTIFKETYRLPVYNPQLNQADYIYASAGTVIIDQSLLLSGNLHRYRFTMAHEAAGHAVLHRDFFEQAIFHKETSSTYIRCREDTCLGTGAYGNRGMVDWMEWQANMLGAAVLMPKCSVNLVVEGVRRMPGFSFLHPLEQENALVEAVSRVFNVSKMAAQIRLTRLGAFAKVLESCM